MIDDMLFQRGHIMIRIDNVDADDYDTIIPDHYFENVLDLTGEVVDSNGSEYNLVSIDSNDNFVINFTVYENVFATSDGNTVGFGELEVECTGTVIQEDDCDVLRIDTFNAKVTEEL